MAKTKVKSEKSIGKIIAEVIKEESDETKKKVVKKVPKKVTKKIENKDISKLEKKKVEKVKDSVIDFELPVVKEKRSRKKIEKVDELSTINEKVIEDTSKAKVIDYEKNENELLLYNKDQSDASDNSIDSEENKVQVSNDDKDIDEIFSGENKSKTEIINNKKQKDIDNRKEKKQFPKIALVGVVVVAILIFAIVIASKTMKTVIPNVAAVNNVTDLNKKLDASLVPPLEVKNVQYGIEGDEIARMDYARKSENGTMNLIFRMSKDPDKDLYGEYLNWGERIIHMDVECADGTIINVESYEALDDVTALIALWKDNNEYYSLFTKNVSTKEDFYREVNQIVAANHKA